MLVRLLETSMLVLFKKRTTKTAIATAVAVSSLTIAQKYKPWLRESDDKVRRESGAHFARLTHGSGRAGRGGGLVGLIFVALRADGARRLHQRAP